MKVYLATHGSYSDFEVVKVFASRADAEAYELGDDVEEFEVSEGPVETRLWHWLTWWPHRMGKDDSDGPLEVMWTSHPRDFDGRPNAVTHRWHSVKSYSHKVSSSLVVEGWDRERIGKVYGEQRAMWLNNKALGMVWDDEKLTWTAGDDDTNPGSGKP